MVSRIVLKRRRQITGLVIIALAVASLLLWFMELDADPPFYFAGHGQSLSTDAHHYSYFARNKILFGQWELFDAERWRVFEVTLVSALSYLVFLLGGISRINANLVGLTLSLLSVLIFLLALRKFVGLGGILLALFLLMSNPVLFVYGRLPYAENAVIILSMLTFFIFVNGRQYVTGKIAIGILVGLAGLAGKIFGFLLIVPIILSLWKERKKAALPGISLALVSCAATVIVWIIIVYSGDLKNLTGYYLVQTTGTYGFPEGLSSPLGFFERFISFGNDSRFYFHAPALGLAAMLAFLIILNSNYKEIIKRNTLVFFLIVWFIAGQIFFMPENYRPLRYIYIFYFALAGLAAYAFSGNSATTERSSTKKSLLYYAAILILFWIFLDQLVFNIFWSNYFEAYHRRIVWYSLPAALAIVILESRLAFLRLLNHRMLRRAALAIIIVISLYNFGAGYYEWQKEKSFNLKEAGGDIGEILGEDAIICGPYAPALLLENNLRGMIYGAGVSDRDPNFFRNHPVTHFVVSAEGSGVITDKFPELTEATTVAQYWIRDFKIILVRINDLTGNKAAESYQPTDYEAGRYFMSNEIYDSALYYIERFALNYPDNKSALVALGNLYPINGAVEKGLAALKKAAGLYPRDFSVILSLAMYYHKRYVATGDRRFMHLARESYSRVMEINPYQADEVTAVTKKIADFRK